MNLAEQLGGEIVNADSVQVYRYFDIGSAKPSVEQTSRIRHHLIDEVMPDTPLDAAHWCSLADSRIADIASRGKRAIVCGGTFLWVKALLYGLAEAPASDPEIRNRHQALVTLQGRPALHEQLRQVDPVSAARLNPNDFVRVSRALEVFELAGRPLSALQQAHGFREPRYSARLVGLAHDKSELDVRIRERCREMFQRGWVEEVRSLIARGFAESRPMLSVGYRQIATALQDPAGFDATELEESVYRKTRVFARRQRTWLREQPVHWLPAECLLDAELSARVVSNPAHRQGASG